jgi:hypothetical protein
VVVEPVTLPVLYAPLIRRDLSGLVLRQATFARLMSSARRMTLRSLGSVT